MRTSPTVRLSVTGPRLAPSLLVTSCLASLALAALPAGEAHAERGEITEQTPYTLQPREVRVGLTDVSLGLFGHPLLRRTEIGTRPIAWIPSLLGVPSYDVRAKVELWRDADLSLAVGVEHMRVDRSAFLKDEENGSKATFSITPIEGWAGIRLGERLRLNGGGIFTVVSFDGETMRGPLDKLGGAVGTSNLQVRGNLDFKVSPAIHLIAGGQWIVAQKQYVEAMGEEGGGTGTSKVEYDLMGLGDKAWSASGELHVTWAHTNLRLGLEYGYYSVPLVNFVVPVKGYMPVLDLYWRI